MKIVFIQAGGTIDKDYPKTRKGYAFEIGEPAVRRILEKAHPSFDFEVISLLKKDSLDMTEEDRAMIHQACLHADGDKIVITHGTDTMIETAGKLSGIKSKVIVLTGAMKPEKFSDSDASFNVGAAVGAMNLLTSGIYIAMNGQVLPWNKVKRDEQTGRFVEA
jgi:L-asparaginase